MELMYVKIENKNYHLKECAKFGGESLIILIWYIDKQLALS